MSERQPPRGLGPLEARLLMATVVVLLVANLGLFLRVNQFQERVLRAVEGVAVASGPALPAGLEAGTPAPAVSLQTPAGDPVSLDDFQGSPVLVMFSSVSCPACQEMVPELSRFEARNPDLPLLVISRGTPDENRALVADNGLGATVAQWEDEVARRYRVPGTPFFYFVDAGGVIRRSGFAISAAELEDLADLDPTAVAQLGAE